MKKVIIVIIILIIASAGIFVASRPPKSVSETKFLLDTYCTITLYNTRKDVLNDGFDLISKYEQMFSKTIETSDISRINSSLGEEIHVDHDTKDIIEKSKFYSQISDGLFDITIKPLVDLWNIKSENFVPPLEGDIQLAQIKVNYENILIGADDTIVAQMGANIDIGGIAKGYIADRLASFFMEKGVSEGIINLGGNVYVIGDKQKQLYKIGIKNPLSGTDDSRGEVLGTVKVGNTSVVTAGVYERVASFNGKDYSHIIDPKTGYPVDTDLLSATIICKQSSDADAISTICILLGRENALKFIDRIDGVNCILVDKEGKIFFSQNFEKNYEFNK